jgi:hypothetical protein
MKRDQEILTEASTRASFGGFHADEFISGAKWADDTMLKKACEWLKRRCSDAITDRFFIEDFCTAMKN